MKMEHDATAALLKKDVAGFAGIFAEDAVMVGPIWLLFCAPICCSCLVSEATLSSSWRSSCWRSITRLAIASPWVITSSTLLRLSPRILVTRSRFFSRPSTWSLRSLMVLASAPTLSSACAVSCGDPSI